MYSLLALLGGVFVSVMLVLNGKLTAVTGIYLGTVIIHAVGLVLMLLWTLGRRGFHRLQTGVPLWSYLGGAIGVVTVVLVNLAFGKISVTAMVALSLFAETVLSVFIDRFGWFGSQKRPFVKGGGWSLLVIGAGIAVMLLPLQGASILAVFLAMLSGVSNLSSRTVNAALARRYGDSLYSTLWNFLTGFLAAALVWIVLGCSLPAGGMPTTVWYYFGGLCGVGSVALAALCLGKLSSFYVTLFTFTGQLFTSIVLDAVLDGAFSPRTLTGGILVLAGLILNLLSEQRALR